LIPVGHQPYLARAPTFRFSGTILSIFAEQYIDGIIRETKTETLDVQHAYDYDAAILPEVHLVRRYSYLGIHTLAFQASSRELSQRLLGSTLCPTSRKLIILSGWME